MRHAFTILAMAAMAASVATGQDAGVTPTQPEDQLPDSVEQNAARPVGFHVSLAGVYDDNINREPDELVSRGVVVGAGVHYRSSPTYPLLSADYEAALHRYSGTERWNRISQYLHGVVAPDLGPVKLATIGEISLKGSSEDRDLSDQFAITQRVGYELMSDVDVTGYGGYRYKKAEDPQQNARNPFGGLELSVGIGETTEITGDARYEHKSTVNPKFLYNRWRYELEVEQELGDFGEIEVEGIYRDQQYPNRMVEIEVDGGEDFEEPRHDRRVELGIVWTRPIFVDALTLGLSYQYETRTSNDVDKLYDDHAVAAIIRYAF
jgi:hypothetical protein